MNTAAGSTNTVGIRALAVLLLAAALLSALAMWIHYPGHVSMDSSMQLYEASLGRSITWNPPYMTAILRWLGTGPEAAGRLLALNVTLTYLALAATGGFLLATGRVASSRSTLRVVAMLVVLANPILLLFLGVIWKDVLFASLITAGAAVGLIACGAGGASGARAFALAAVSAVVLAVALKVRQQGIFMAPVLLIVPVLAATLDRGLGRSQILARTVALIVCFGLASFVASAAVERTIQTDPSLGSQVGFRGLMQYDVAGMTALSQTPTERFPVPMSGQIRDEVRRVYSPDRGDFLWYSPTVTQWLSLSGYEGIRDQWWTLVRAEPGAYLSHRWGVFLSILNVDGVKACLPVHVGIDGNHGYLKEIGFSPGLDRFDQQIYYFSQKIIRWPIYRHWVYLAALVIVSVLIALSPMERRIRWAALTASVATALLYASYLPTSIACDFRYLFPATCMVSLLWIVYLARAEGRPRGWAGLPARKAAP